MTTLIENLQSLVGGRRELHVNWRQFVREHILGSWWLALWLVLLTYVTAFLVIRQYDAAPVSTLIIVAVWALTVALTAVNEITRQHIPATLWLKNNLYSSITNVEVTLILSLLLVAAIRGFVGWAVVRASFTTDAELAAQILGRWDDPGANWGAVMVNFRNLMVFRFPRDETWRLFAAIGLIAALAIPSTVIYRERYRKSPLRRLWTLLWLLSPIAVFFLLLGVGGADSPIPRLNPQTAWGGLLLTLIIAVFAIVASFPLGLLLALGRRSTIRGIPRWVIYSAAGILTIYFLITSTLPALGEAQGLPGILLAFWPLLFLLVGYLFNRHFKGNVVALISTLYIECVRGVPFITILFMSIILFPIFLPPDVEILGTWRVMVAAALFAAAYLAENVRGGLQAIPKGQYEAADAIGLSAFKKYRLIILPQALRAVIPAIVGQFIGLYKDTTLVAIVGLIELLGVANLISAQQDWLGVRREPYVFIALIYFIGSAVMAGYSRRLEARLGVGRR